MIAKAAVKIFDIRQNKEIIIPCHRHCDAYEILYNFGYRKNIDYHIIQEGFLDENGVFLDRHHAYLEAMYDHQLQIVDKNIKCQELFSEDLY